MNKYKLILATSLMLVPTTINLNAESIQKNYVNWCSDQGSGGCPTIRQPYPTPVNNQLVPNVQPMLVPRMLPKLEPRQYMAVPQLQQAPNLVPQLVPNRVPQAIPNRVPNLEPKPIEQRVPQQVLPEQKVPGFAKTIGRPGEVNLENKPKEIKQVIDKKTYVVKLLPKKHIERMEKLSKVINIHQLENKIIKQHLEVVDAVRGASKIKQDPTTFVLGGLAVAASLAVKRRNTGHFPCVAGSDLQKWWLETGSKIKDDDTEWARQEVERRKND